MDAWKRGGMEATYVHASITPNFHTRRELAEFEWHVPVPATPRWFGPPLFTFAKHCYV
mgnify:CR=1 FL=1